MFEICNKLDEEFPNFTFGSNRQEDALFVNGQKLEMKLPKKYEALRDMLLKEKIIKYPKVDEEEDE